LDHGASRRRREREKVRNLLEEIMAENFPNLGKETDTQIQEAQRVSNKRNPERPTPRHIMITCQKLKTRRES